MTTPVRPFADIVAGDEFSLAEAFLAFARAEYPALDPSQSMSCLAELGRGARSYLHGITDDTERLSALGVFLAREGFEGDRDDYYDPRNSFLNEVLDRRVGIPISLSVVWIETGLRVELPVVGIGMPMHFLVGLDARAAYVDPFAGGRLLTSDEAVMLFGQVTNGEVEWRDEFLEPATGHEIVRRALGNLKAIYGTRGELDKALWVEDHLLEIPGTPDAELVERAAVKQALQQFPAAIADLRAFLAKNPETSDEIESAIIRLQAAMN